MTPQQNDVVERRSRTLVEAAQTMLIFSKAPMFLWAEAVATACYTQNRSLIHTRHNKIPYELVHNKKHDLTFFRVFSALCYPTNDNEDLRKLQPTADIEIFVDLEILFQPMFDEYLEPPRVERPVSPAPAVQVPVNSAGTPSSTTIDQDAPSPSHSPANQDNSQRINRSAGYENQRLGNVAGARETVGSTMVKKSGIQCYNCKEFRHIARECQKPKRAKDAAYHSEKMLLYVVDSGPIFDAEPLEKEEARIQLNAEQADWRDDTDDELEDQELEAHYMYMAQIQEVSPDAADFGPIFDSEPVQKVSTDNHYNVFSIESEHPEQSESIHDTYSIEQYEHNVIIDSLDMSYDREQIDLNDDDNDLANEQAQIKLYKTHKDKELDKVIALENKVKVLDNIVYKTGQSVQTMNMLNNKCRTSFAKPKFLKKAQRANPLLYDIDCYNDNLALMLAPESDEVIRLEKESRSKLSDLIRPFDYDKLNNLYDLFVPQREKYQASPTKKYLEALKRVFRYLKGTINWGLWYSIDTAMALTAYAYTDHAGCQDTRRKTMADVNLNVNAPAGQALAMAPPTRIDDQILPRSRWVPVGKRNFYLDVEKDIARYICLLDKQWFDLTKDTLGDALQITPVNKNNLFSSPPTPDALINFVNNLGYPKVVRTLSAVMTNDMFQSWRALTAIINLCLTGKTLGFERPRAPVLQIL
nr:putative ribonuclease H-like domain-containing protein [Tanacetum cinerariifolium]